MFAATGTPPTVPDRGHSYRRVGVFTRNAKRARLRPVLIRFERDEQRLVISLWPSKRTLRGYREMSAKGHIPDSCTATKSAAPISPEAISDNCLSRSGTSFCPWGTPSRSSADMGRAARSARKEQLIRFFNRRRQAARRLGDTSQIARMLLAGVTAQLPGGSTKA